MRTAGLLSAGLLLCLGIAAPAGSQTLPGLTTRWARDVDTARVLPEYPRPQMTRPAWQNLNGWWQYAVTDTASAQPTAWTGRILVPFAIESQLSRVRRAVSPGERLWYRRTFRAPPFAGGRLLLHFGAVDWDATVYLNGRPVGRHRGGYDPFSFDITDALRAGSEQELVVSVWDPSDGGEQPRGKQVRAPRGIWYTSVTGIWQTAWLEPVPPTRITALDIRPDVDSSRLVLRVSVTGAPAGERIHAAALAGANRIAQAEGALDEPLVLPVPDARLWSPDDPFLYDLRVQLASGDSVSSYFGMRKIGLARDSTGVLRLFLNNRPLFQYGPLDQGWWPDGLYTAPTDEALRYDVEMTRRLGFNMARKHVKVEPARWYYHADRLGLLVWQDMPSANNRTPASREGFASELENVVDALRNHPSIVMWVPFNEGWGQHDTERHTAWLEAHDPTRPVNSASGWTDHGTGDVADLHAYPGPTLPERDGRRALVLGEFGGLGLPLDGHTWLDRDNWGYRSFGDTAALGRAYQELIRQVRFLIADGLAAAVYTQTTDVEIEVNGIMTYDREIVKLPAGVRTINERLHDPPPRVLAALPTSRGEGQPWRYTTLTPAEDWTRPGFDDSHWSEGIGGFGRTTDAGTRVRTPWTTSDLWLRRRFELPAAPLHQPALLVRHDEAAEVWINGVQVAALAGYNQAYTVVPLDDDARSALHPGTNSIAVHVRNTRGGQYIDVGIIEVPDVDTVRKPDPVARDDNTGTTEISDVEVLREADPEPRHDFATLQLDVNAETVGAGVRTVHGDRARGRIHHPDQAGPGAKVVRYPRLDLRPAVRGRGHLHDHVRAQPPDPAGVSLLGDALPRYVRDVRDTDRARLHGEHERAVRHHRASLASLRHPGLEKVGHPALQPGMERMRARFPLPDQQPANQLDPVALLLRNPLELLDRHQRLLARGHGQHVPSFGVVTHGKVNEVGEGRT